MGLIYSWGSGSDGALGHGDAEDLSRPRLLEAFGNEDDGEYDDDAQGPLHNPRGGGGSRGANRRGEPSSRTGKPLEATLLVDVACGADLLGATK